MIRKRGKMGQPDKNGTRYEKCTLALMVFRNFWLNSLNFYKNSADITISWEEENSSTQGLKS